MPTGIPFEITPEILHNIEQWAGQGLSQDQIASCLGVNTSTLTRKKAAEEQVRTAIERGRAKGIQLVTNALFDNATEHNNLGAQCFFLKNRDPANWADRHDLKVGGAIGMFEIIDYTGDDDGEAEDEA